MSKSKSKYRITLTLDNRDRLVLEADQERLNLIISDMGDDPTAWGIVNYISREADLARAQNKRLDLTFGDGENVIHVMDLRQVVAINVETVK
tara:strand:+ start:29897 stop:30172 length:276 start_codon:yes stop_codon:yes gene_type:complete